jgi:hypothetical protein
MFTRPSTFQTVSKTARTLKVSRRTVQRNAPSGSHLRTKDGLVDVDRLRQKLWIGAPLGAPGKSGYPAGVPRRASGAKGQKAWAKRDQERQRALRKKNRSAEYPSNAGIPFTLESVVLRFGGWLRWVQEGKPFADWERDSLRGVRALLTPISSFVADLDFAISERNNADLSMRTYGISHSARD